MDHTIHASAMGRFSAQLRTVIGHIADFLRIFWRCSDANIGLEMQARREELEKMSDAELEKLGITRFQISQLVIAEFMTY